MKDFMQKAIGIFYGDNPKVPTRLLDDSAVYRRIHAWVLKIESSLTRNIVVKINAAMRGRPHASQYPKSASRVCRPPIGGRMLFIFSFHDISSASVVMRCFQFAKLLDQICRTETNNGNPCGSDSGCGNLYRERIASPLRFPYP
jgi:hypothetical protein